MKKFFIAALAITTLASCTQDSVIDSAKNAIAFDNTFIENSTRSVSDPSITNSTLADFAVYGFVEGAELFDGDRVAKNITNADLSSTWKYEGTQYWVAGAKYNFAAVAPYAVTEKFTITSKADKNGDTNAANATTTFTFTNDGETDLLYADAGQIEGKASGNALVSFNFRHILSKVKFSFLNDYNATNATIQVSGVQITNAIHSADVQLVGNITTWTPAEGDLVLDFGAATHDKVNADDDIANEAVAFAYTEELESYKELLLIPGEREYNVKFNVDLIVGETTVKTYAHTATVKFNPEAGKCYDIIATITPENIDPEHKQEPIEFTVVELPDWTGHTNVTAPTTPAQ